MKNRLKKVAIAACLLFAVVLCPVAQEAVRDVVTLKNGRGTVKGFIYEQIPGDEIRMYPAEAVLKFNVEELLEMSVQKNDSIETDILVLKDSTVLKGRITEQAPGKWVLMHIPEYPAHHISFRFSEIEKIGKEAGCESLDIFSALGVIDVLETKNGAVSGIIMEQTLGHTLKIKTPDNRMYVYDVADIVSSGKEAYNKSIDLFRQSALQDVLFLKDGSRIKGIIIKHIFGQEMQIETVGNSVFVVKLENIEKIAKEVNPNRE